VIRIVDYGVGNIQAFLTMYKRLGLKAERAQTAAQLSDATKLILPGVGAFDRAMTLLNQSGMRPQLEDMVLKHGIPVLGVCVGMQMLATSSEEGTLPGLNWIAGRVRAFSANTGCAQLPLPHMGWNNLEVRPNAMLFSEGFQEKPAFYFLHSFYFESADPTHVAATANYGISFDAVVSKGHVHGIQCHPEKSHHNGAALLKNFAVL
jgi:imidazole glycerol-phosphate synthase subunit HisH